MEMDVDLEEENVDDEEEDNVDDMDLEEEDFVDNEVEMDDVEDVEDIDDDNDDRDVVVGVRSSESVFLFYIHRSLLSKGRSWRPGRGKFGRRGSFFPPFSFILFFMVIFFAVRAAG